MNGDRQQRTLDQRTMIGKIGEELEQENGAWGRRDERGAGSGASATTVGGSRWERSAQGWTGRAGGGVNGFF